MYIANRFQPLCILTLAREINSRHFSMWYGVSASQFGAQNTCGTAHILAKPKNHLIFEKKRAPKVLYVNRTLNNKNNPNILFEDPQIF